MQKPVINSYLIGGRRRLYWKFPDGREMIEEYVKETNELISRVWKSEGKLGKKEEMEIGDAPQEKSDLIQLSNSNPFISRKDSKTEFIFRIRNLAGFSAENFQVGIDSDTQHIVVRTTNKKYFTKIQVPDLTRMKLLLKKESLGHKYSNSTLIVTYKKPQEILEREEKIRSELERLNKQNFQEGDLECTTQ